jgi:hypothetical protein
MFDEASCRRPDFIPGVPVTFPGGVVLELPQARRYYFPLPRGTPEDVDSRVGIGFYVGVGRPDPAARAEQVAHAEAVRVMLSTRSDFECVGAIQDLARRLIGANYDIAPEALDLLLTIVPEDEEDVARGITIGRLARGLDPIDPQADEATDAPEGAPVNGSLTESEAHAMLAGSVGPGGG